MIHVSIAAMAFCYRTTLQLRYNVRVSTRMREGCVLVVGDKFVPWSDVPSRKGENGLAHDLSLRP